MEIMVGLIIGMIGIIVMMQVFSVSEANKRTTTGGDDAQNNGAIALYKMQRDIRQGGYGMISANLFGCSLALRSAVTLNAIAPVMINPVDTAGAEIIPDGDANTDTVLVIYGNSGSSSQGDGIVSQPTTNVYKPKNPTSFVGGDWVIVIPQNRPSPCALTMEKIGSVTPAAPAAPIDLNMPVGVASSVNGTLYNMGQSPKILAYAVRGGNLALCDFSASDCGDASKKNDASVWMPIASNIVSMRAQYGKDVSATMDAIVDEFDNAVDVPPAVSSVQCGWARVSAVRLALVARSGQYNKDVVTAEVPVWAGSEADHPAGSAMTAIDLSADTDWQHYRYKVFQTTIPLRNVAWMGVPTGC